MVLHRVTTLHAAKLNVEQKEHVNEVIKVIPRHVVYVCLCECSGREGWKILTMSPEAMQHGLKHLRL